MSGPNDHNQVPGPAAYPYAPSFPPPQDARYPPQSSYPPPPQDPRQYPQQPYPYPHQHQHPPQYAPHPAHQMYPHPHDPLQQGQYGPQAAAAPRQRTAIACRYCRRRKIRCSGFETSADGRCSNCIRFNQDCMFTPVSSQTQAFVRVPEGGGTQAFVHVRAWNKDNEQRGAPQGVPPVLYGAHGQPLPPSQQPQSSLPRPQGMYNGTDDQSKRRGDPNYGFEYPDPTNLAPVTPTGHPGPNPYYYPPPPTHERRTSPPSAYAYDARHSSSPHGSPYPPMAHHAPMTPHQVPPGQGIQSGPAASSTPQPRGTPPPASTPSGPHRSGLNVRDMLNPGDSQGGRSSTDSDMLNALNRRGPQ